MAYFICQVDQVIHLLNIVYTCLSLFNIAAPPGLTAIQSSTLEETMDAGKLQTGVGASDDDDSDEDYLDSEGGETSDDEVC